MSKVAIIGCGIIGMTTAISLQKKNPTLQLTIFAKEISPNTTSDVAAGLWEPVFVGNTCEKKIMKWSATTYNQLLKWWKKGKAKEYGICIQPAIYFNELELEVPLWLKRTLGYQKVPQSMLDEMSRKYDLKLRTGFIFITFTLESSVLLPRFQKKFIKHGGKIIQKEIKELKELSSFDVIVNCTGLESKNLVGDKEVKPIRGYIKKVEAPWQFYTTIIDSVEKIGYIIPNTYQCTLGGTATISYEKSVNQIDKKNIERNCLKISPSLSSAKTIRHVVGLRPGRSEVRLEIEIIVGEKNTMKVVHNYGHGGAGITLAFGCADEAANLVNIILGKHKL